MTQKKPQKQTTSGQLLRECPPTTDRLRFLENLQEISAALIGERDLDAALAMISERAAKLVNAETAAVGLVDYQKHTLQFVHSYGKLADKATGIVFPIDGNAKGGVITSGRAALFNDMQNDPRVGKGMIHIWGVNYALVAPMKMDGQILGILAAWNGVDGPPFTEEDLWMFSILANHAAVAIRNAQLYAEMRAAFRQVDTEKTKLEAVLNNLGDGVVVCNAAGKVILANKAAETITGLSARDMMGKYPTTVLPKIYATEVATAVRTLSRSRREDGVFREMTVSLDSGKTIRVHIHPVFSADNSFFGTATMLQDITKTVQLDQAKSEFVSTVAHELRTPLTALKGSIGLVLGGATGDVDPSLRDLLDIAQNNCNRLIRLVDDMMDIAKIELGRFSLQLDVATVQDCVIRAVNQMRQFTNEREVNLSLAMLGLPRMVVIDKDRIEQVIVNMLSNAIKFSPPNSEIKITVKCVHGCVRVSVTDQGPGIPREDHSKVFEKFYQSGKSRRNGGSGLGLAICKAIIEEHGGKMYVKSVPGEGSTFAFLIPVPGEEALMTVKE